MHVLCNANACPYDDARGNGLAESDKVLLARNQRTNTLAVIGADDIDADEVLGQYFGKVEHVSAARSDRSRNTGFRLLLDQ